MLSNATPVFFALGLLTACVFVALWEMKETLGESGKLQTFCREKMVAFGEGSRQPCMETLIDLELVERDLVRWRTQFVAASSGALVVSVLALATGCSLTSSAALFIIVFVATALMMCLEQRYADGHIHKHPREARLRCLRNTLGADLDSSHSYYQ